MFLLQLLFELILYSNMFFQRFTSEENSTEEDGSDKDFQQFDGAGDTDVGVTSYTYKKL